MAPVTRFRLLCAVGAAALSAVIVSVARDTPPLEIVSGRATPRATTSGKPQHWSKKTVHVVFDRSLQDLGPWAEDEVAQAFGSWLSSEAILPKFRFDARSKRAPSHEADGENRVYYAPITLAGHEQDIAITLSHADDESGAILEADIIVNSRYDFGDLGDPDRHKKAAKNATGSDTKDEATSAECDGEYDLRSIVAHEVGHFLGLGEDLEEREATMYYRTSRCDLAKRDLLATDIESVASLYAASPLDDDTSGEPTAAGCRATPGQANSTSALFVSLLVTAFASLRVRNRKA